MNRRFEITDEEWDRLALLLPSTKPKRGGRWRDHRQALNGILFRVRSGVPWRDLPERYGPWTTCHDRYVHATHPEVARAHLRIASLDDLPERLTLLQD